MNAFSESIIQDATTLDAALTRGQQTIDSQSDQLQRAADLHSQDSATIQKLADQLAAVTADDQSVGAKLLTFQGRLNRLAQLAKPNMALNLHRLPSTPDPGARPIMTWFQPGNSGNTGGLSAAKHGTWTMTQNADGSTDFAIAPAMPFDNYFWALNLLKASTAFSRYIQVTEFEVPDEALALAMGVETNWERSTGSSRLNAGIQALLGTDKDVLTGQLVTNQWRYYDIFTGHWVYTGIPLDRTMFGTGKRIQLVSEFAESSGGMQNISLAINGVVHPVNKFTKALPSTWGPYLQAGFQVDCLQAAKPFTVKVWNQEAYWL
jgi:hypothetical protein